MAFTETLAELVAEAGDIGERGDEYDRRGTVFAARPGPDMIEVRLGDEIAEAARRTPDTAVSPRGDAWVRFTPAEWDQHALDRLAAWFRVAWRLAGKR
jgi:hypothetical protein